MDRSRHCRVTRREILDDNSTWRLVAIGRKAGLPESVRINQMSTRSNLARKRLAPDSRIAELEHDLQSYPLYAPWGHFPAVRSGGGSLRVCDWSTHPQSAGADGCTRPEPTLANVSLRVCFLATSGPSDAYKLLSESV